MARRREVPRDFNPDIDDEGVSDTDPRDYVVVGGGNRRPETDWQALMEAEPFDEPEVSRFERLELRDVIADAIDELDEQERWIFDALFVRRLSLREVAREISMPKTTVARWRDRMKGVLIAKLESEPKIIEYLEGI